MGGWGMTHRERERETAREKKKKGEERRKE
jgi:hypothetical protein